MTFRDRSLFENKDRVIGRAGGEPYASSNRIPVESDRNSQE